MFSGLTNQFTSLVGAVKGGAGDEDVPAPTGDAPAAAPAASTSVEATASSAVDPRQLPQPVAKDSSPRKLAKGKCESNNARWVILRPIFLVFRDCDSEIQTSVDLTWRANVTLLFVPFNISLRGVPALQQSLLYGTFIIVLTHSAYPAFYVAFRTLSHD